MKMRVITVSGTVVKGDGYGKELGFPTVNLDREDYKRREMSISLGVYAGTAEVLDSRLKEKGEVHKAGIVIGPFDKTGLPKIEAHLLDFSENIYGKRVRLSLLEFLRPFETFRDEETLQRQIYLDIEKVRKVVVI